MKGQKIKDWDPSTLVGMTETRHCKLTTKTPFMINSVFLFHCLS